MLPQLEQRRLRDGIYDVSGLDYLHFEVDDDGDDLDNKQVEQIERFAAKYPDFVSAQAYQCYSLFLFSRKPERFRGKHIGSDFNHGSTNLLARCPESILILAEDD